FVFATLTPAQFTLFPYTTLFRSDLILSSFYLFVVGRRDIIGNGYVIDIRIRSNSQGILQHGFVFVIMQSPIYHTGKDSVIGGPRSEEHTSEFQSRENLVCRLLLE